MNSLLELWYGIDVSERMIAYIAIAVILLAVLLFNQFAKIRWMTWVLVIASGLATVLAAITLIEVFDDDLHHLGSYGTDYIIGAPSFFIYFIIFSFSLSKLFDRKRQN